MPSARSYQSYEEFERDELQPLERPHVCVEDLFDDPYAPVELDFDGGGGGGGAVSGARGRKKRAVAGDDESE